MTYQELKNDENQYVMNTYGRFPMGLEKGEGSVLWDFDGKSFIDFASGIGVNSVGYHNPAIVSAISEQAAKLMHTSNLFTTEPMVKVAKTLVTKTDMGKVFFANSGAEANEGAIKLARKYSFDKYGEGRNHIVTLHNSFHGRTITTIKATGQEKFHNYFFPFTEGFDYAEANNFESLKSVVNDKTCAVMMELIQGEGGVLPLDREFVKQVEAFCKEKDLLLIIDEVQTGVGRTGALFCFQNYGIKPDVVTMAKGLGGGVPIGAVLAAKNCCDVLTPGTHATTFGGNPIVCASANAVLSIVANDAFLAEVKQKGAYIVEQIQGFGSDKIQSVRGMGLMIGVLVDEDKRADLVNKMLQKGVIVLTAGKNTIRLLPPLTISYSEIDEGLKIMQSVLA